MNQKTYNLIITIFLFGLGFTACNHSNKKQLPISENEEKILTDSLLDLVQYQTFQYFWDGAEPTSGMARERIHLDNSYPQNDQNVITLGGSGFGVMAILVGIERRFITREQALKRYQKIVDYLGKADRFHGVWPH